MKAIVTTESTGSNLVYRLDTLKSKFIPSRSHVRDYFNRDVDFGFKHRRINMSLNFTGYQVDILCRNDTIFLSTITSGDYKGVNFSWFNKEETDQFLEKRNKLYKSSKTQKQLVKEISLTTTYAFYCGDGSPKTGEGIYVWQLVDDEDASALIDMVGSFSCETQSFGVAGLEMLEKSGYPIPRYVQKLIDHIKKRDSELVVCYGCLSGLIDKIYSRK